MSVSTDELTRLQKTAKLAREAAANIAVGAAAVGRALATAWMAMPAWSHNTLASAACGFALGYWAGHP